jgi:hypothetical protein
MTRPAKPSQPEPGDPAARPACVPGDDLPSDISSASLCNLTGYTDSTHRKAADAGYFPKPVRGTYKTVLTLQGLFRRERALREKARGGIDAKRERKLDKEIEILELDTAERKAELLPVDDVYQRLRPACVAMRQRILSCSMMEDEKGDVLDDLGRLLTDLLRTPAATTEAPAVAETEEKDTKP